MRWCGPNDARYGDCCAVQALQSYTRLPVGDAELVAPHVEVGLGLVAIELEVERDPVPAVADRLWIERLVDVVFLAVHRDRIKIDLSICTVTFKRGVGPAVRSGASARGAGIDPPRITTVPRPPNPVVELALPIPAVPLIANMLAHGELHAGGCGGGLEVVMRVVGKVGSGAVVAHTLEP